jgi:hypothetical protein
MAKRSVIRDSKTGRFASLSTYKRSKAQGGTRYKRYGVKPRRVPGKRKQLVPPSALPLREVVFRGKYNANAGPAHDIRNIEIHFGVPPLTSDEKINETIVKWIYGSSLPSVWREPQVITWRGREHKDIVAYKMILRRLLDTGRFSVDTSTSAS